MLNQDLSQPKEVESKGLPIIEDPKLCDNVVDFLEQMIVYIVDNVDAEVRLGSDDDLALPGKFHDILIEGKGLNVRVGKDKHGDVAWDIHFGIEGRNRREDAEANGITIYDTFQAMVEDIGHLKGVVQANPQIVPSMIVSRTTNNTMLDFAKRIGIVEGVLPSKYRFEGDMGEADPMVFDKDKFFEIMEKVDNNVSYRDNLKVILGK